MHIAISDFLTLILKENRQVIPIYFHREKDNGPIDGGNYWSTHPNNDPYYFDDDNVDWYPFEHQDYWI